MSKEIHILVIADKYSNFAAHSIYESARRGLKQNSRVMSPLKAMFLGDTNVIFHWGNHQSLTALYHARVLDFDEIHLAGYIDEDMVDYFEIFRDAKKRSGKQVKVIVNESGS